MKRLMNWLMIIVLCFSLFASQTTLAQADEERPLPPHEDAEYVPGELIVVYGRRYSLQSQSVAMAQSIARAMSAQVLAVRNDAFLMKVDENTDMPSFAASFRETVDSVRPMTAKVIAYAEPNFIFDVPEPGPGDPQPYVPPVQRPNSNEDETDEDELRRLRSSAILPTYPEDPLLWESWGWWNTSADVVWQERATSPVVCLLDTGVDGAHPDLAGMIINGKDIVNNDAIPDDDNGHGTMMAGVISAKANNKVGLAGVSTSKILAVKVLNSEGYGDSWDIGYGIRLCADNASVKILSMSFGSYGASSFIYDALRYAIAIKGKVGVAAAGNGSTSDLKFPAAWAASYVCADGWDLNPPGTVCGSGDPYPNLIYHGLISVAASRSYWSSAFDDDLDGYLWVDTNGNTSEDWFELYDVSQCASWFSNVGAWVNIVAPGEDITSTVPVTYPFYQQYNLDADPEGDGYDTWSGTSMSTPFVTGTVARVWSLGVKLFGTTAISNTMVKDRLLQTGYPVTTALDPLAVPFDGYYSTYSGEAPYCWPDGGNGPWDDNSNARVLDMADAMNRTSVYAYVYNATNGLPLKGATVGAYLGTTVVSAGLQNSNFSPLVVLPNIPRDKVYDIKVNKAGFTSGPVVVSQLYVPPDYAYFSDSSLSVSVPAMGKVDGVIDWVVYDQSTSDLDMYTWLPNTTFVGGVVGCCHPTSLNFWGDGRLLEMPRARWNHDGGTSYDWAGTESVTITLKPGSSNTPYYNVTFSDYYDFMVYDYEAGALNQNEIYFRLWNAGKIKATVHKTAICDTDGPNNIFGDGDDQRWWQPGYMVKDQFFAVGSGGICGTGNPYANGFE